MINERGALELSINTIVIVVIGITLLTLGLVFVRGIFGKLNELSDETFGTAQAQIGRLGQGDASLIAPSVITVKQGQSIKQNIIVGNDGTIGSNINFAVEIARSNPSDGPGTNQVAARIVATGSINKNEASCYSFKLSSGESLTVPLVIGAIGNAKLTTGLDSPQYSINVKHSATSIQCGANGMIPANTGEVYQNSAFIINVEKGAGLFG